MERIISQRTRERYNLRVCFSTAAYRGAVAFQSLRPAIGKSCSRKFYLYYLSTSIASKLLEPEKHHHTKTGKGKGKLPDRSPNQLTTPSPNKKKPISQSAKPTPQHASNDLEIMSGSLPRQRAPAPVNPVMIAEDDDMEILHIQFPLAPQTHHENNADSLSSTLSAGLRPHDHSGASDPRGSANELNYHSHLSVSPSIISKMEASSALLSRLESEAPFGQRQVIPAPLSQPETRSSWQVIPAPQSRPGTRYSLHSRREAMVLPSSRVQTRSSHHSRKEAVLAPLSPLETKSALPRQRVASAAPASRRETGRSLSLREASAVNLSKLETLSSLQSHREARSAPLGGRETASSLFIEKMSRQNDIPGEEPKQHMDRECSTCFTGTSVEPEAVKSSLSIEKFSRRNKSHPASEPSKLSLRSFSKLVSGTFKQLSVKNRSRVSGKNRPSVRRSLTDLWKQPREPKPQPMAGRSLSELRQPARKSTREQEAKRLPEGRPSLSGLLKQPTQRRRTATKAQENVHLSPEAKASIERWVNEVDAKKTLEVQFRQAILEKQKSL